MDQAEVQRIPGTRGDALRAIESNPRRRASPGLSGYLQWCAARARTTRRCSSTAPKSRSRTTGGYTSDHPHRAAVTNRLPARRFRPRVRPRDGWRRQHRSALSTKRRRPRRAAARSAGRAHRGRGAARKAHPLPRGGAPLVGGRLARAGALEESGAVGVSTAPVYYDYQAILSRTSATTPRRAWPSWRRTTASSSRSRRRPRAIPGSAASSRTTRASGVSRRVPDQAVRRYAVGEHAVVRRGPHRGEPRVAVARRQTNPLLARSDVRSKLSSIFTAVAGFDVQQPRRTSRSSRRRSRRTIRTTARSSRSRRAGRR